MCGIPVLQLCAHLAVDHLWVARVVVPTKVLVDGDHIHKLGLGTCRTGVNPKAETDRLAKGKLSPPPPPSLPQCRLYLNAKQLIVCNSLSKSTASGLLD